MKRCMQFCIGLLITGLFCTGYNLLLASLVQAHWVTVPFSGMGWVLRSVLFEKLFSVVQSCISSFRNWGLVKLYE